MFRSCGACPNFSSGNATKLRRCVVAKLRDIGYVHPALPVYECQYNDSEDDAASEVGDIFSEFGGDIFNSFLLLFSSEFGGDIELHEQRIKSAPTQNSRRWPTDLKFATIQCFNICVYVYYTCIHKYTNIKAQIHIQHKYKCTN